MEHLLLSTAYGFSSLTSFLIGAVCLALSMIHRSERTRKAFVLVAIAFGCQGLRHTFLLAGVRGAPFLVKASEFLYVGWVLVASLGVFTYVGRTFSRPAFRIAATLLIGWPIIGLVVHVPMPWSAMPSHFASGALWCAAAFYLWRHNREMQNPLPAVLPVLVLTYALNVVMYPFAGQTWYGPYGFAVAPFLSLAIGIGLMLTALLEEQQELLREMDVRRQVEEALRESEARLSEAQKIAQLGHWMWDIKTGRVEWSEEVFKIFRLDPNLFTPEIDSILALSPWPDDRERDKELIRRAMESREKGSYEQRFLRPDKSIGYYISSFQGKYDDDGNLICIVGTVQDITERKQAEEAVKRSEEKYRLVFDSANDAIFINDEEGRLLTVNNLTVERLGYTRRELMSMKVSQVDSREEGRHAAERIARVMETGRLRFETVHQRKDGSLVPTEVSSRRIVWDDKPAIMSICRDVTERKRLEDQLRQARNLESIGTLAGGIAHDFNNLLMTLSGNIALAKMCLSSGDEAFRFLAEAERISLGGADLTNRLITFAKGGTHMRTVASMSRIIKESSDVAVAGTNVRCEYSLPDVLLPVKADEAQMRQVIHNIVLNAKEAMPRGGTVRLAGVNMVLTSADAVPLSPGDYVRITIEDHGTGIKEEDLPRIFDPYFTTKGMGAEKGMGLGLTVVYSIIKKHNGHVAVESLPGKGTTVRIYLPAHRIEDEAVETQSRALGVRQGKILFMDDEKMIRDVSEKILNNLGYTVTLAADGMEAIQLYKSALDSDEPFDAVILDLIAKKGMGGQETISGLRSLDPHVKAIICSGYTDDPVISNYKDYGFKAVLTKPHRIEDLKEILLRLIPDPGKGDPEEEEDGPGEE